MPTPIYMPRPGQMTEECTVLVWLKHEGDAVSKGDVMFEIETDKASMEVEAFDEGTLLRILVAEGQTVPVNTIVAWIGQVGEAIPESPAIMASHDTAPAAAEPAVVARLAPAEPAPAGPPAVSGVTQRGGRMTISPRASRLAAELGVDPRSVAGSGPNGRIVERDIRAAAGAGEPGAAAMDLPKASAAAPLEKVSITSADLFEEVAPEPLTRLRQVIASRLSESVTTIPQFTVTVAVDMTLLVALRAELRRDGSTISITDVIHYATAQALVDFPLVNARTDGRQLWRRERVHLGMAVSMPAGLLVPVMRDAHVRSLPELSAMAASLVERARAGRLGPDDLSGSTFTVSNMGMFGVEQFGAIINPGESAILAVSSILPTAVAIGDGLAVRQVMRLTLTADHRLVDGELSARFLNGLRRRLEDVSSIRMATTNS
jgi:pyruvate dehydrogenase E2 component (dihydrolipoamide acetyltransferase)